MAHVGNALSVVAKAMGAEDYNILQNNGTSACSSTLCDVCAMVPACHPSLVPPTPPAPHVGVFQ
jgi:hypothetical protein